MRKKLLSLIGLTALLASASVTAANSYGIPDGIQEGNILHCFDWTMADVKAELPNIAAAGFGSVQLSPLQRADVRTGSPWHDLYRPYDLAFKGGLGSEQDLKDLCQEAAKYGIKIIVDVVANHVDKTAGYHDTWWDSNGRVRWQGGINYGDRGSITHGQLGDYGDINSEDSEVQNRAKAYIQKLHDCGVKGIRWDAAKHIGLPSEGCQFWPAVTSVPGMYHYGEILDAAGPNKGIIKEYCNYMSVTDNQYCNYAARDNGGVPAGYAGDHVVNQGCADTKMVYWAESHDTYSNDDWSCNRDQSVIDRAYAAFACRNGATALYFSRPNTRGFNNIKVGKGSTSFKSAAITAVNKFRNAMVGRPDWCEFEGNAGSVTRKDGGAVIVMKGSGNVSVKNGGGYCPAGTYKDMVSGGTFTVTSSTISGNVGSSGIAVIMKDGVGPDPGPGPQPQPGASMWMLGNLEGTAGWSTTPGTGAAMTADGTTYTAKSVKLVAAAGETSCYFNFTDYVGSSWDDLNMNANRYGAATEGEAITLGTAAKVVKYANNVDASGCLSWTVAPGTYDITLDLSAMTVKLVNAGDDPGPGPQPQPGTVTIEGDYNLAYSGTKVNVYYWPVSAPSWPGTQMATATGSDGKTYKVFKVPAGTTGIIFNTDGDSNKTGDLTYTGEYVMDDNGATTTKVTFKGGDQPGPQPQPGEHYVYYDGTFSAPQVWAWNDSENCTSAGAWPGDNMTQKNGKWYWEVPSGKSLPTMIIIHEGDNKIGGGDLAYVDKATYHQDGTTGDEPGPGPQPGASLYILGNLEGAAGWSTTPGTGKAMTANGSVYTADGVKFVTAAGETLCYFNLTDYVGSSWDDLNMNANRYGSATEGEAVTLNSPSTIVKYANNVDASGCLSWTVPAGTYSVKADLSSMKLTVSTAAGIQVETVDDSAEAVYYNLQGVRVDQPAQGVYIKVSGNKATKVYLY